MQPTGRAFRDACYQILRAVPKGHVTTYGDIARALRRPGAARAVGTAMRMNEDAPATPCHRVVTSDGKIGHYSGGNGTPRKIQLLESEGVHIREGRVADFEKIRWPPRD